MPVFEPSVLGKLVVKKGGEMRSTLTIVLGVVVILISGTFTVMVGDLPLRVLLLACSVLTAFLLGLGVGERFRAAFNHDVTRVNCLLGEQNQDLCETILRLQRPSTELRFKSGNREGNPVKAPVSKTEENTVIQSPNESRSQDPSNLANS